jgi:hypothetical protein
MNEQTTFRKQNRKKITLLEHVQLLVEISSSGSPDLTQTLNTA